MTIEEPITDNFNGDDASLIESLKRIIKAILIQSGKEEMFLISPESMEKGMNPDQELRTMVDGQDQMLIQVIDNSEKKPVE